MTSICSNSIEPVEQNANDSNDVSIKESVKPEVKLKISKIIFKKT